MKTKLIIAVIMMLAQLAVPGYMIYQRENTLKNGETFLFKTAPVDPFDAFRGRYVALNFDQTTISLPDENTDIRQGNTVYTQLEKNEHGVASLVSIHRSKPKYGAFLRTKVRSAYGSEIRVKLPFDRFYMDEFSAPEAERLYRKINRWQTENKGKKRECYAQVKVLDGLAVLEGLIIDGREIKDALKEQQ